MSPTRASEGSEGYLLSVADVDSFCCRGFDRVAVEVKPLRAGFLSGVGEKSADVAGVCHKSAESGEGRGRFSCLAVEEGSVVPVGKSPAVGVVFQPPPE